MAASGRIEAQGVAISALPDATSAGVSDMIPCVQSGVTRRCTPAEFLALLTGGVGIGISGQTVSTASNEADFLISGALACGASTQGKVQVHSTTPLQYCDNAGTPTLRYAAYGNATGECLSVADNSIALGTKTTGGYAASVSEAGPATTASAAASDPANCSAGSVAGGVDASWVAQDCLDPITETELDSLAELNAQLTTTIADGPHTVDTDDQSASEVVYTPIDGTDWTNPDPDDVADGLDKLADRLTTEEAKADDDVPESGDFGALALTGPVTSSGVATSIASDAITEAMLKSVNASTDEFCLTREDTTGDFEWQPCDAGAGDVVGPASATDECFARYDLTTGKLIQNSLICSTDGGAVTGITQLTVDGSGTFSSTITNTAGGVSVVSGGNEKIHATTSLLLAVDAQVKWVDDVDVGSGVARVGLIPGATGELKVTNGSTGSGDLLLDEEQELRFAEANVNGANYLAFKSPAAVTTTQTCTLEDDSSMVPDSCVGDGTDDDLPDADEIVESMLKAVDSATDEECLTFETTTGDFEWQACGSGGGSPAGSGSELQYRVDGSTFGAVSSSSVSGANVTLGGTLSGATQLNVDNLRLDGNTLSSTDTNGNLVLDPNGTGMIALGGNGSTDPAFRIITYTGNAAVRLVNATFGAGLAMLANEFVVPNDTTPLVGLTNGSMQLYSGGAIFFRSAASITTGSNDAGVDRFAANELNINNGSVGGTGKLKKLVSGVETLTIVDNGTGSAATGTLTFTKSLAKCDCGDANGCDVTLSETGMADGWQWTVVNISANPCNFADTSGVSELPAGGVALGQWDSLSGYYVTDRFVLTSTSNN